MKGRLYEMKKISIITPLFNAREFIKETIESVLLQTYTNWELIFIDDCSTDDTAKIIESYCAKDDRMKLIKHKTNKGVAASRNTALDFATGEYIAFLDGDDLWLPNKLKIQLDFMENNRCVLTYTGYQKYFSKYQKYGKIIKVPKKMTYNSIFYNTSIACLTVMVNRELSGPFKMPNLTHTEDLCTWQLILRNKYIAFGINENLALYRVHSNSLTGNKFVSMKKQWNTYREFYGFSIFKSFVYFVGYGFNVIKRNL